MSDDTKREAEIRKQAVTCDALWAPDVAVLIRLLDAARAERDAAKGCHDIHERANKSLREERDHLAAALNRAAARAEKAEAENWKDAERRAADLVAAVRRSEQAALARVAKLEGALRVMLERFVGLVASGDAGSWDPESEPEVVAARAALNTEEGT
jgi:hypothetical protein